ncbi:MAG TPA: hypothetical protein VFZ42_05940 [Chitinophagaceae bacterium]
MADNPNKKKADSKRVSQQKHEQSYQRKDGKGQMQMKKNGNKKQGDSGR